MTTTTRSARTRAAEQSDANEALSVHFLPDYTDANPYQARLADALRDRGVSVRTTGGGGGPFPILAAVLDGGPPDVVHVHFLHQFVISSTDRLTRTLSALLCLRALVQLTFLRTLGVSLVWTAHDLVEHERRAPRVERAFKHVVLRFLFDRIVVHCERARRTVVEAYRLPAATGTKVRVVPHGNFLGDYPDEVTRAEARAALDLPRDGVVVGFFGSIRAYKDVPRLVETFGRVARPDDTLLVAGNPRTPETRRAVERAAAGDERVHTVFEYVPDDEVQLYLRATDVVVLPFRTDERSMLTSGSALLAMGFGRPVVAPDVGCVGALVEAGNGFAYDPDDDDALASAMYDVLHATDLEARGRTGREVVRTKTWDRAAERTHDLYRDCLDGRS